MIFNGSGVEVRISAAEIEFRTGGSEFESEDVLGDGALRESVLEPWFLETGICQFHINGNRSGDTNGTKVGNRLESKTKDTVERITREQTGQLRNC